MLFFNVYNNKKRQSFAFVGRTTSSYKRNKPVGVFPLIKAAAYRDKREEKNRIEEEGNGRAYCEQPCR